MGKDEYDPKELTRLVGELQDDTLTLKAMVHALAKINAPDMTSEQFNELFDATRELLGRGRKST